MNPQHSMCFIFYPLFVDSCCISISSLLLHSFSFFYLDSGCYSSKCYWLNYLFHPDILEKLGIKQKYNKYTENGSSPSKNHKYWGKIPRGILYSDILYLFIFFYFGYFQGNFFLFVGIYKILSKIIIFNSHKAHFLKDYEL